MAHNDRIQAVAVSGVAITKTQATATRLQCMVSRCVFGKVLNMALKAKLIGGPFDGEFVDVSGPVVPLLMKGDRGSTYRLCTTEIYDAGKRHCYVHGSVDSVWKVISEPTSMATTPSSEHG